MEREVSSRSIFLGISVLLLIAGSTAAIAWCGSMASMGEVPMAGGWTMSMAWLPMCGQTWSGTALSLTGMWAVMMVPMMLPSLVPMLWRYRQAIGPTGEMPLGGLTILAGLGYFFIWTLFGAALFPLGISLAGAAMRLSWLARAVPMTAGLIVLGAGLLQLTAWKAHHLARCRTGPGQGVTLRADADTACRYGLSLGIHCWLSCVGWTAALLALGALDWRVMAGVAIAVTVERLAPNGERAARAVGAVAIGIGLLVIMRASGLT